MVVNFVLLDVGFRVGSWWSFISFVGRLRFSAIVACCVDRVADVYFACVFLCLPSWKSRTPVSLYLPHNWSSILCLIATFVAGVRRVPMVG